MSNLISKQRELFDKEFPMLLRPIEKDALSLKHKFQYLFERREKEVGDFLNTCLIEHYEEDIRKLEGKMARLKVTRSKAWIVEYRDGNGHATFGNHKSAMNFKDGYNSALSLAISLLQDKIKELKK